MSDDAIPIYRGRDFYVPTFEVRVGAKPLPKDVIRDVISVSYTDNVEQFDTFTLTLNNWDARTRQFKYSDDDRFDPGKTIELWMGYHGQDSLRLMLTGHINTLQPTFPASGQPTLQVSGVNLLFKLRTRQASHEYRNRTDSQIAKEVGQRLNVEIATDPVAEQTERPYRFVAQRNAYDILFLMERARRVDYDLFVEEVRGNRSVRPAKLYFGPSVGVRDAVYRLTYGKSLIHFQPTLSTANQVSKVRVRSWDDENKRTIEYVARRGELRTRGVGHGPSQVEIDRAIDAHEEVIVTSPVKDEGEGRRVAVQTLEHNAKQLVSASGSTIGLPDLRAGRVVVIDGLDRPSAKRRFFDGRYFLTSTTHAIADGGYTTTFQCRREEL